MASQDLSLILKAQNQTAAAFSQLNAGLKQTEADVKKIIPATNSWTDAQQRAAQQMANLQAQAVKMNAAISLGADAVQRAGTRMNNMHEEGLRMNASMQGTSDKAQLLAANVNNLGNIATGTAKSLGATAEATGVLSSAGQTATVVMGGMTKAAFGLNAATVGVAGAGLALGAAIGSWLNTFPAVTNAVDKLTFALWGTVKATKATAQEQKLLNDAVIKQKDEQLKKQLQLMLAQGKSAEQIKKWLADETKGYETSTEMVDGWVEAEKKRTEAAKKASAAAKQYSKEEAASKYEDMTRTYEQIKAYEKMLMDIKIINAKEQERLNEEGNKRAVLSAKYRLDVNKDSAEGQKKAWKDLFEYLDYLNEQDDINLKKKLDLLDKQAGLIRDLTSLYVLFGGSASDALGSVLVGIQGGIDAIKQWKAAGKDAFGQAGAVATGIFAIGGMIDSWVESAHAAEEKIRKLREEVAALIPVAEEAGLAFQGITDPRTGFLQMAIDAVKLRVELGKIKDEIDLWEEATDETRAAMEEYGITIDQMGERFAQQELDKEFGKLLKQYELLTVAGADVNLVNEKMAENINKYIQDSLKAGTEIPLAMKPILESLLKQGLLTDEAGEKLTSLEGLSFSETVTAAVDRIVLAVEELIDALRRAFEGGKELYAILGDIKKITGEPVSPENAPPPKTAEGGWFPYRPGGHVRNIGEAGNEAVLNEPQIKQLVAQGVAMAMAANGGSYMGGAGNIVVNSKVHIDGREIGKASSKAERRRQLRRHPNSSHTGRW